MEARFGLQSSIPVDLKLDMIRAEKITAYDLTIYEELAPRIPVQRPPEGMPHALG